jgi:glycosyltransferase involved in cell wall biosynthesis
VAPRRRILYFISSLEQGGAERQLAELIGALDLDRFEPLLAVCKAVDHLGYTLPSGAALSLAAPAGSAALAFGRLRALLRERRPDLVHTWLGEANLYGRLAARAEGIPCVASVRCTRLPRTELWAERLARGMGSALIVNSAGIRDELARRARVPADAVDVIENGVDLQRFRPLSPAAREAARARLGLGEGCAVLVPGRLSRQKNQRAILRALRLLRARGGLPPTLRVHFAGRGSPPWYGAWVEAEARALGLTAWVRFLGVVGAIQELVAAVDVVLLPSHYEGLPNAVVEAMASGTPALVSPAANADGLVTDGREGLCLADPSPEAIADGLRRFLALSPEARGAQGERGRRHAEERFAVSRMARRTMEVYRRVLGDPALEPTPDARAPAVV